MDRRDVLSQRNGRIPGWVSFLGLVQPLAGKTRPDVKAIPTTVIRITNSSPVAGEGERVEGGVDRSLAGVSRTRAGFPAVALPCAG